MKNGQCPKCGSQTVYSQPNGICFHNSNSFHVRTATLDRNTPFMSYLCTTCGYFENYATDPNKLAEAAKTWPKVPAPA